MAHKSFNYIPSAEESRDRSAAKMNRRVKIKQAKEQDWKREALMAGEASMMDLLGYTKYNS